MKGLALFWTCMTLIDLAMAATMGEVGHVGPGVIMAISGCGLAILALAAERRP